MHIETGSTVPWKESYPSIKEKNMKKFAWFLSLVVALSIVLSACGAPATTAPVEKFRVAVVMPSSIKDLAFSQSIYDGLMRVQTDMGGPDKFEIVYSENMFVVDDAAAAIRDYATKGYNLVIAHGSQYGSSLQELLPISRRPVLPGAPPWIPSVSRISLHMKQPPRKAVM